MILCSLTASPSPCHNISLMLQRSFAMLRRSLPHSPVQKNWQRSIDPLLQESGYDPMEHWLPLCKGIALIHWSIDPLLRPFTHNSVSRIRLWPLDPSIHPFRHTSVPKKRTRSNDPSLQDHSLSHEWGYDPLIHRSIDPSFPKKICSKKKAMIQWSIAPKPICVSWMTLWSIALWESFNGRCNICISLRIFNFASHFFRIQIFQIDL